MPLSTESVKNLIFDWDGTLNDSAHNGFAAFQKSFGDLGVTFTQEFYEAHYSPNWYTMYEALQLPQEQWRRADDLWIHHYGEAPATLVEGARETMWELHRRGYRLGIVTSGSHCRVAREIAQLELQAVFQAVICNEHIVNRKPHPEGLEQAMRLLNASRECCAYIGDAPEDIEMGKRARVLTIGVRSGYPGSKRLSNAGPDIYLDSITELPDYF